MKFSFLLFSLFSLFQSCFSNTEQILRDTIFENYSSDTRPAIDKNPINLVFGIAIRAFNSIDQVEGTLSTNVWIRHYWNDIHLRWDPQDYNNLTTIAVNTDPEFDHNIWIPDMYLYNTAEKPMDNLDYSRANLYSNGDIIWSRPGLIKSTCSFDLEYFPYDRQTCSLKFGSWVYHKDQMNISIKESSPIDISNYQQSDGWKVLSYKASYNEVKYGCCPEIYPDITFTFYLERKSGYYDLNIIIPTYATASLMIISLIVPWDSGERISFAITVMLSLIVFLLILSESLPKTDAHPLLSKMLVGLTFFSLFVVFFTVIISALYSYKTNKDTPFFQFLRFAKGNPVSKRISQVSRRIRNSLTRKKESVDLDLEVSEEANTEFNETISKIEENDKAETSTGEIEYRTNSYNQATGDVDVEVEVDLDVDVLTTKENTIKRRRPQSSYASSSVLSETGSVMSNNSKESKKSVKMYKKLASKLELIFTIIFFLSFVFYSVFMFTLVPY